MSRAPQRLEPSTHIQETTDLHVVLRPALVLSILVAVSLALVLLDFATYALDSTIGSDQIRRLFNVDEERSVPTWFSSMQLLLAHALLLAVTFLKWRDGDRYTLHWGFLALLFLMGSIDEAAGFHEFISLAFKVDIFGSGGGSWVFFAAPVIVAIGFVYLRFLNDLPRQTAFLFCLAAAFLITGAMGLEMLDVATEVAGNEGSIGHLLAATTEELLERLGVSIFIYALLIYLSNSLAGRRIRFS